MYISLVKRKLQFNKKFSSLLIIIFILLILVSGYKIIEHHLDDKNTSNQLDVINDVVTIEEIDDDQEGIEVIEQEEIVEEPNPYWDYIKMNMIDVDFNELKEINKDVKGWIQVNGTNINYPFSQADDNSYYLTHSFDKSYNSAGWIFLDYRNNISINDRNTILFGHGRVNQFMFGSLSDILTSGWLNNSSNHVVKLSTEYQNTLWQVFSVYRIPTTSDYIQTNFRSDEEFSTFVHMLLSRSAYNFNTTVSSSDRILTLSTCYNNMDKVVLHAKLIKREVK